LLLPPTRNQIGVKASERLSARLGAILSVILALWGLAFAATPLGAVGGAVAAVFGLAFGATALLSHAWGRWRLTALAGIGISILALLVFAVFVLLLG
jgi:hypothetical protein